MPSEKFESLISPPWPPDQTESSYSTPPHRQRQKAELAIFERNDESDKNVDHIAILGYD